MKRTSYLGSLELDPVGNRLGEAIGGHTRRHPVEVGVRHVAPTGGERLEGRAQPRDARGAQRPERGPVVGDLPRDHLGLGRVAGELVVLPRELERGLDRLAATAGEEHAVEVAGRQRRHPRRQLDRARVRVGPVGVEAQLASLVGAGLGDIGAPVADVHAEQRGQAVEVAVAVLVVDVAALAAHDDGDVVVGVGAHPREVHPQVALRQLLKAALGGGGVLGGGHARDPPPRGRRLPLRTTVAPAPRRRQPRRGRIRRMSLSGMEHDQMIDSAAACAWGRAGASWRSPSGSGNAGRSQYRRYWRAR